MEVIRSLEEIPRELEGSFATIGNFDGVHRGHRVLFRRLIEEARPAGAPALVITFEPHPKSVLLTDRRPFYLITTPEEKIREVAATGVDALLMIPFNRDFAALSAEAFVRDILWKRLRIRKIFIGHDYRFGRGKEGNEAFLVHWGKTLGFAVETLGPVSEGGIAISSTRIRNAIFDGDVRTARHLLGRPYNVAGRVVHGHRRGTGLGFPTANVLPGKELLPARGVYAAITRMDGRSMQSVLNIGYNPTFGDAELSVEVFILDFRGDLYGEELEILFIDRLRPEMKFDGPGALVAQIRADVARAESVLADYLENPDEGS
jgi:riboflavin kinase / FMN adenylyltransferase